MLPKKRSLSAGAHLFDVGWGDFFSRLACSRFSLCYGGYREKLAEKINEPMHAPIRISPTQSYYHSYFYQVDALASQSNYSYKTIGEKEESPLSDPYSAEVDSELPVHIPPMDRNHAGKLLDPVKELYRLLGNLQEQTPNLAFQDYEISGALMQLRLNNSASSLSQMSFLLSIPDQNPNLPSLLLPEESSKSAHFEQGKLILPDLGSDFPAILPKSYRENGVKLGDSGIFSYAAFFCRFDARTKSSLSRCWVLRSRNYVCRK